MYNENILNLIQDILRHGEQNDGAFMIDRTAFTLALVHRAYIFDGHKLVAELPKLKTQFEDCLAQQSDPLSETRVLFMIASDINDENTNGYVADCIRHYASG